jgi:hypothetical protein
MDEACSPNQSAAPNSSSRYPTSAPYLFRIGAAWITISGKRLAAVVHVRLRHVPKWVWGKEPGYAKLKAQKRYDPTNAPDARAIVSDHIAAEMERLGWTVSYQEPGIYSDITTRGGAEPPSEAAVESARKEPDDQQA